MFRAIRVSDKVGINKTASEFPSYDSVYPSLIEVITFTRHDSYFRSAAPVGVAADYNLLA